MDIPRVEFNGSGARIPLFWNIHVGSWLRHYVYEPLSADGGMGRGELPSFTSIVIMSCWEKMNFEALKTGSMRVIMSSGKANFLIITILSKNSGLYYRK